MDVNKNGLNLPHKIYKMEGLILSKKVTQHKMNTTTAVETTAQTAVGAKAAKN